MNQLYINLKQVLLNQKNKTTTIKKCAYTNTPNMLTRETLDQRKNLGGNDAHKVMY